MNNDPFAGWILCEKCGEFQSEENTMRSREPHDEWLSITTCCRAGYTDLDGQAVVDELERIRELSPGLKEVRYGPMLDQTTRNNLETIQILLEGVFDL